MMHFCNDSRPDIMTSMHCFTDDPVMTRVQEKAENEAQPEELRKDNLRTKFAWKRTRRA
jgi:hypothetical protein